MKKKDRYKLITHAINDYKNIFNINYERKTLSEKDFQELLSKNRHSSMCEWCYCCRGLYNCCWQELWEEGNWDLTQKEVDKVISSVFFDLKKDIKKDKRMAVYATEKGVYVIIIARDLPPFEADYIIYFTNNVE
jgi:hypothetical protein